MNQPLATDARKIQFVRDMFGAWMRQDWEAATRVFTPDGALQSMMLPTSWQGHEAIRTMCVEVGRHSSNINIDIRRIGVVDGAVVAERVDSFLWDGRQVAYPTVGVFEFENGRIKLWKEYFDRDFMLRQMGVTATDY